MVRSFRSLPRYLSDLSTFRSDYRGRLELLPCLHDWFEEAGAGSTEYFSQDLLVARMVFEANPRKHVDVGSRIDGFVAHVASFRQLEVLDIRPNSVPIPGVTFRQVDLTAHVPGLDASCDSLSCLHALEHFGLGRYGDRIDARGHESGLTNIVALLETGGTLYLSVPIGVSRVEFNGHRVFDPRDLVRLASSSALTLAHMYVIQSKGRVEKVTLDDPATLAHWASQRYALGLFVFLKH